MRAEWLGFFGRNSAADGRRIEFNLRNEQIVRIGRRPELLFIGDSITQHWETDAWFPDYACINRGIGGDISSDLALRFQADALDLEPERIVLLVGINDLNRVPGDSWWKLPGPPAEETLSELLGSIDQMAEQGRAADAEMFLCSLLPLATHEFYGCETVSALVLRANAGIRGIAARRGCRFVDYHPRFVKRADGTIDGLCRDGLHPDARGYELMSRTLREVL